jgi:hypothetical protein
MRKLLADPDFCEIVDVLARHIAMEFTKPRRSRNVSYEPALGPVSFWPYLSESNYCGDHGGSLHRICCGCRPVRPMVETGSSEERRHDGAGARKHRMVGSNPPKTSLFRQGRRSVAC